MCGYAVYSGGMKIRNQIKRTLLETEVIENIHKQLNVNKNINRTELADWLCDHYGFLDSRGTKQRSGCLKALRELEKVGHFTLPAPQTQPGNWHPRRLLEPVPVPVGVPENAGEISEPCLEMVETVDQIRIWNEMMIREHPRGAGPLVGCQLRYLVGSEYGWLGGFGFSSAALQLKDRDRWIGWDIETRRNHLLQ